MENIIARLEYYNPKKEIKTSVPPTAKDFYKGRKMILIAFENNAFLLPRQYPLGTVYDCKEHEMNSTHYF